jgi:serine/threonine-protein kinase HipA
MKRTLKVCVGDEGRLVGTLHYDHSGVREHAAFAYDESWLAAADRFALEPNLPLVTGMQFHRKAPGRPSWNCSTC